MLRTKDSCPFTGLSGTPKRCFLSDSLVPDFARLNWINRPFKPICASHLCVCVRPMYSIDNAQVNTNKQTNENKKISSFFFWDGFQIDKACLAFCDRTSVATMRVWEYYKTECWIRITDAWKHPYQHQNTNDFALFLRRRRRRRKNAPFQLPQSFWFCENLIFIVR